MKRPRFALLAFVGSFLGFCLLGLPQPQRGTAADPANTCPQYSPCRAKPSYGYDEYGYEDYAYEDVTAARAEHGPVEAPPAREVTVAAEEVSIAPSYDPTADAIASAPVVQDVPCNQCEQNHWVGCLPQDYDCDLYDCCDDRLARDVNALRMMEVLADDRHSYGNEEIFDINLEHEGLAPVAAPAVIAQAPVTVAAKSAPGDVPQYSGFQCEYGSAYGACDQEYRRWLDQGMLEDSLPRESLPVPQIARPATRRQVDCDIEYLHYPCGPRKAGAPAATTQAPASSVPSEGAAIENNALLNDAVRGVQNVGRTVIAWTTWLQERVRERTELPPVSAPAEETGWPAVGDELPEGFFEP